MEGSLGRDGKLRKESVTNKGCSVSATDEPHSEADLEHSLFTSFEINSPLGPARQH